jgi:hypothetical protein
MKWYENQHILLALMLSFYIIPIAYVYYTYNNNNNESKSISSILTSQDLVLLTIQTRHFIAVCMFIMAVFTIIYEFQRCVKHMKSSWWSLFTIVILLIGIFGVIYIPETNSIHYIFAGVVFLSIIGFMTGHTIHRDVFHGHVDNFRILLYTQFLFMVITIIGVIQDAPILTIESIFLLNFAVFYLYLHYHNHNHNHNHNHKIEQ